MSQVTRLIRPDDAPEIAELLRRNRAFFEQWVPARSEDHFTTSGQQEEIQIALAALSKGKEMPRVIIDGSRIIGLISLSRILGEGFWSCVLGYSVTAEAGGRGHASAAVAEICEIAFGELELHRIEAVTTETNVASRRVLERAGFQQLGVAPGYAYIAGAWRAGVIYQRLTDRPNDAYDRPNSTDARPLYIRRGQQRS
jgi:ribosomal-protein-alanine N-acetyltransferase